MFHKVYDKTFTALIWILANLGRTAYGPSKGRALPPYNLGRPNPYQGRIDYYSLGYHLYADDTPKWSNFMFQINYCCHTKIQILSFLKMYRVLRFPSCLLMRNFALKKSAQVTCNATLIKLLVLFPSKCAFLCSQESNCVIFLSNASFQCCKNATNCINLLT